MRHTNGWAIAALAVAMLTAATSTQAAPARAPTPQFIPTGQFITPTAAPGAIFQALNPHLPGDAAYTAGQAAAVALAPDGKTLLILTSGYNLYFGADGKPVPAMSEEYVFVFDVSGAKPVQRQAIAVRNTFQGLAWSPDGARFYVSGGVDDAVYEFAKGADGFAAARTFDLAHKEGVGLSVKPATGALAVSPDGSRLLVANFENDSVSVIDLATGMAREQDLRPGVIDPAKAGTPGGSFPRAVLWTSPTRAYVASERDREVIALDVSASTVAVAARIRTAGQPVALAARGRRLYAALDNADAVAVIDTGADRLVEQVHAASLPGAPAGLAKLGGAGTDALALSGDGRTLYVSNGGANDVAVIRLASKPGASRVVGLIPTGWYPTALAARADGRALYVVNGKSEPGPNTGNCRVNTGIDPHHDDACRAMNQYVW
jgi:DNA-binding beta-propeller fold protein YncE